MGLSLQMLALVQWWLMAETDPRILAKLDQLETYLIERCLRDSQ